MTNEVKFGGNSPTGDQNNKAAGKTRGFLVFISCEIDALFTEMLLPEPSPATAYENFTRLSVTLAEI